MRATTYSEVLLTKIVTKQIVLSRNTNGLNPFYGKIMGGEVDAKMNDEVK